MTIIDPLQQARLRVAQATESLVSASEDPAADLDDF
jgi:hypothetical protein